jgi:hypothetical protein
LDAGVHLESDAVHEHVADEGDVESVSRVIFQVVVPSLLDARGIMEGDRVAVLGETDGVVFEVSEKLCEGIHVFVEPPVPLRVLQKDVLSLQEFAEREVMVRVRQTRSFDGSDQSEGEDVMRAGDAKSIICLGFVVSVGLCTAFQGEVP